MKITVKIFFKNYFRNVCCLNFSQHFFNNSDFFCVAAEEVEFIKLLKTFPKVVNCERILYVINPFWFNISSKMSLFSWVLMLFCEITSKILFNKTSVLSSSNNRLSIYILILKLYKGDFWWNFISLIIDINLEIFNNNRLYVILNSYMLAWVT